MTNTFAGGNTQQLMEYWVHGKGAAKIRWGTPNDFARCVRHLRKYFPKNPEGLCNHLHTRALGVPPGKEHAAETEEFAVAPTATEDQWDAEEAALVPQVHVWSSLIAPIDQPTGDRRRFAPGSLRNRDLPLPLMWQEMTDEGHARSVVVGRILEIEHTPEGTYANGDFLDPTLFPAVEKAMAQIRGGVVGPSVDLDDMTYEFRNMDGSPYDDRAAYEAVERGEDPPKPELVVTDGRISGATLVAIPAFAQVKIELGVQADEEGVFASLMAELAAGCEECDEIAAVVASAGPARPSLANFADPKLTGPTPVTITDDGRVYGHLAAWDSCHVGFADMCVTPPPSVADYAYFHTGEMVTDDGTPSGTRLPVGRLVVGTKHATLEAGFRAASQHYDETGRVAAYVRAGEDAYGIWISGVIAPGVDEELVETFRANPLSGDWRRVGGSLELVGACSVPVPGFPIARATAPEIAGALRADAAAPVPYALVAAGAYVVAGERPDAPESARTHAGVTVDLDEITEAVRSRLQMEARGESLLADLEAGRQAMFGRRRDELLAAIGAGGE